MTFVSAILARDLSAGRLAPDTVKAILRDVARGHASLLDYRAILDRANASLILLPALPYRLQAENALNSRPMACGVGWRCPTARLGKAEGTDMAG